MFALSREVAELPVQNWSEWDSVELVKAALRDLEFGVLHQSALVVDAMTRDDRISGVLLTRVEALPSLPFTMGVPEGEEDSRFKEVADDAAGKFDKMCPNADLVKLHQWGLMLGLGIGQLIWEKTESEWTPRLEVWHPSAAWYEQQSNKLFIHTRTGDVEVVPGDGQWVVYAPYGLKRGWMYGKIRNLYVPWLVRQWGWRDWARKSEVYGIAIRKAKTPAGADEADKQRFIREVAKIGRETVIRLPQPLNKDEAGFDLELLEAESDGHLVFKDLLAEANSCIAINLLGQNLTTEVKGGAYAAAQVHENIRASVLRSDAQNLGLCLQSQLLRPWARVNYGDEELAPLPTWATDPPEDKASLGTAMKNIGDGLTALRNAGAKPDTDEILEVAGVPVTGESEEPEPMDEQGDDFADEEKPALNHQHAPDETLASLPKKQRKAIVEGQLYLDRVADEGTQGANVLVSPLTVRLLEVVHAAKSYRELKSKLRSIYDGEDWSKYADLVEKALILAELEGRHAVLEEE